MTAFAPADPAAVPPPFPGVPLPEPAAVAPSPPGDPGALSPSDEIPAPPPPETAAGTPPADPFRVEAIIATVGLAPFLDRTLRRVHLYHFDRAAKIGEEIDRKLYQFLGRDDPAPSADLPPWDFETVRADIETVPLPQHTTAFIGAFGDLAETGLAAVQVAERIQNYLKPKVPHRRHESLAGPVEETPPHSDVARFRRLWNVARDPLSVLDDLNEYALSRDMANAVADMYPLLWKRIDDGIDSQLARKKGVLPHFRLSIRKEMQLRILGKREDVTSKALGIALQAQFAAMAAEATPKPAAPRQKSGADTEASAADRIGSSSA